MNRNVITYILGYVMQIEAILMLVPCVTAICYGETEGLYYLGTAVFAFILGFLIKLKKPINFTFYLKEGCIITSLSWIVMSLIGCLPLMISGEIPNFTDALFETVSGFTTTGATILSDVESLSHCANMWRCFTHWIGGMGVLVFLLAVIPLSGGSHINIMKAESPGPSVGKLVPKVKQTARILYIIYLAMTVAQIILLLIGGMPLYDSLATSFATAGTGGFGIKNDSIAGYSSYIQWVTTIFMILFGVNFNAYYLIIYKHIKKALKMEEVRCYFLIIIFSTAIVFAAILDSSKNIADAVTKAAFQVASIITTTGFSTTDFDLWSGTCKTVIVMLMFIGACAGSTGGGIKVSRFIVLFKTLKKELTSYIHPKSIQKIKTEGKPIEHEVIRSINVYIVTFVLVFSCSVLLVSLENQDLITNFTAVAATINNIGPGLSLAGPSCNFGFFSVFTKYVLIFDMLAGRLELFPLLILFHPTVWKDMFKRVDKKNDTWNHSPRQVGGNS